MNYWESHTQVAVRFRRFARKRYAAIPSMHKVNYIGDVTASTQQKWRWNINYATIRPARHGASSKDNRA